MACFVAETALLLPEEADWWILRCRLRTGASEEEQIIDVEICYCRCVRGLYEALFDRYLVPLSLY